MVFSHSSKLQIPLWIGKSRQKMRGYLNNNVIFRFFWPENFSQTFSRAEQHFLAELGSEEMQGGASDKSISQQMMIFIVPVIMIMTVITFVT